MHYDTALCSESQEQAERLIGKVNNRGKARLLKLNVKNSPKLLKIVKTQSDAGVTVDDEQMEVVEHFKYHDSLKSADGNGKTMLLHIRSRIGMAKKRMFDQVQIWRESETRMCCPHQALHTWRNNRGRRVRAGKVCARHESIWVTTAWGDIF